MPDLTAKRTLVKSPPELWEELSEVDRLAKHLSAFGEITITTLEPEHTVAWEGERASGTVSIEPSGWGTKVTLRAELPEPEEPEEPEVPDEPEPEHEPEPEPAATAEPEPPATAPDDEAEAEPALEPAQRRGLWGWLFRKRTDSAADTPIAAEPEPSEPEPEAVAPEPELPEPEPSEPEPSEPEPEAAAPEPEPPELEPASAAEEPEGAAALDPERARVILDEALDTLGAAHHRPFSRG